MNSQHTPGPWNATKDSLTNRVTIWGPNNVGKGCRTMHANVEANANLIAAAPDLLSALEDLLALTELILDDDRTRLNGFMSVKNARYALRKAKGES